MISKEEVNHIAKLAKLRLTEKETKKLQKDLVAILSYVKKLEELNLKEELSAFHPTKLKNITREDEPKAKTIAEVNDLVKMVPEKKGGYVKTKRILFI